MHARSCTRRVTFSQRPAAFICVQNVYGIGRRYGVEGVWGEAAALGWATGQQQRDRLCRPASGAFGGSRVQPGATHTHTDTALSHRSVVTASLVTQATALAARPAGQRRRPRQPAACQPPSQHTEHSYRHRGTWAKHQPSEENEKPLCIAMTANLSCDRISPVL